MACPICKGSGSIPCPSCKMSGYSRNGNPCTFCNGTGRMTCTKCGGDGADYGEKGGAKGGIAKLVKWAVIIAFILYVLGNLFK